MFTIQHDARRRKKCNEKKILFDNRPGGGTVIGTQFVAKAPADGYTMLMVATSMAVNPSLRSRLPYDTMNDFMPVTMDLLSGEVSWMFGTILPTIPHIKAGKLRAIAVSSPQRAPVLPDVPAVAETLPGFDATSWYGLFAPAGTPKDVIAKLHAENARIITLQEIRERLIAEGAIPAALGPEAFRDHFRREVDKWGKVVKAAGIKPD